MPINRWERTVQRLVVHAPFNAQPLARELIKLHGEGCFQITFQQERHTDKWHIEAVQFIRVTEEG